MDVDAGIGRSVAIERGIIEDLPDEQPEVSIARDILQIKTNSTRPAFG